MKCRLIIHGPENGFLNMAIDEALLRAYKPGDLPILRIYMWKPSTVSIGYSQDVTKVVKIDNINNKGYNLVRRLTGGGALLHAENAELTYSVILPINYKLLPNNIAASAAYIADAIRIALNKLGIPAERRDTYIKSKKHNLCYLRTAISDIKVKGRKISGSAQYRGKIALLQHGTLLLDFNPQDWIDVISMPKYFTVEQLKSKITSIKEYISSISINKLIDALIYGFEKRLGFKLILSEINNLEKELVNKLIEKYKSISWTYDRESPF